MDYRKQVFQLPVQQTKAIVAKQVGIERREPRGCDVVVM